MNDQEIFDRLDETINSLSATIAELENAETAGTDDREALEEIAQANRRGDRGNDWQKLQQCIDRGETSLEDIFSGKDISREAKAVSGLAKQNLASLNEQLVDATKKEPTAFNPQADAQELADDLAARVEDIKRQLGIN